MEIMGEQIPLALVTFAAVAFGSHFFRPKVNNETLDDVEEEVESLDDDLLNVLKKPLCEKDKMILDILSSKSSKTSWCLTDPDMLDNPIIYANSEFCSLTGYSKAEIQGRNCRFLQGKDTRMEDVKKISDAIKLKEDTNVCILNYKKDGTPFVNQFFICCLHSLGGEAAYYIGVQAEVQKHCNDSSLQDLNPGWVYTMGLKE
mmetsp:Transcript_26866/g.37022  ORF Transcript_26866/g.37022 Transcript_26866/m.37022 type:complete len:202 (-) Transcript_26866:226-831(-)|eukprot:CAMPEP_0170076722 /NCGR_PEP_ID=MMETSP0019_2-20121128/13675_1 /TAXON_ID=98059 /ORGANISM="Dinobryon sp., Strain UTEXLB2267" /LENGTH=201 /DNA_ID=CAMNT_0010288607 /DNA_START=36 /DNA_END=641 /DNA_ORIENTATION=-